MFAQDRQVVAIEQGVVGDGFGGYLALYNRRRVGTMPGCPCCWPSMRATLSLSSAISVRSAATSARLASVVAMAACVACCAASVSRSAVNVVNAVVVGSAGSVGGSVGGSGSDWESIASISVIRIPLFESVFTRRKIATSLSVYRRGAVVADGERCRLKTSDHRRSVESDKSDSGVLNSVFT